ncbi:MAG: amino acid ABC transporter substrate-binding protein [Actinobacteria bacterium RBG_16_64_13]|nr:MAG: amino acid ABC transporter substrate-binding protein [Actinobacteria bacterium RBG_16_64_13]
MSKRWMVPVVVVAAIVASGILACGSNEPITSLDQLEGKRFAVPRGTVADSLVLSRVKDAEFTYFGSALDCCLAVKDGKVDAAAYDEPILRNIAAKYDGLVILSDMITVDDYGFAVAPGNQGLKAAIDDTVKQLKDDGTYEQMVERWLPGKGAPGAMPAIPLDGSNGVLTLGTAPVTEPFSFIDGSQKVVGFDIELATYVAQKLGKSLQIISMDFGEMIPKVAAGEVDMVAACITITEERSKAVLFSEPYYQGGIAALVRK